MSSFTPADLRKYPTLAEKILWEYLRAHRCMGFKFRRQHQIGRTIVDFVCLKRKLVIEADGSVHEKHDAYDQRRDRWLNRQGYRVLRFENTAIEQDIDRVIETIKEALRHQPQLETTHFTHPR